MSDLSFTCPRCLMTSHNTNDVREGYCGNCHAFTGVMPRDYDQIRRALHIATQRASST